jgi:hypothetical protein
MSAKNSPAVSRVPISGADANEPVDPFVHALVFLIARRQMRMQWGSNARQLAGVPARISCSQ